MKTAITLVRPRFFRSLVLAIALFGAAFASSASVFVSVNFAPPPLPVYEQPICPGPSYVWVPGYWAYGPEGYYWVPGTWVLAPYVGALWTPGYWGWGGTVFVWHPGYWGPHVGFYGGIDYGFGYFGVGYVGGYWNRGAFFYNTAVTNVNLTVIHNTYSRTVAQNSGFSHVSFNGGAGGTTARPTAQDRLAERDHHRAVTPLQAQHEHLASTNRTLLASVNHGSPPLAATPRAAAFGSHAGTGSASGAGRAPHIASAPSSRELRAESKARHVAPSQASREFRAENQAPHANAGPPQVQRFSAPERHAQNAPQFHGAPAPERHAQRAPQIQSGPVPEHRAQHAPPVQSNMPSPERHAFNAPRIESAPAPQFHAQNAPRMQSMPAPERHAEGGPRPQGQAHEGRGGEQRHEEGPGR